MGDANICRLQQADGDDVYSQFSEFTSFDSFSTHNYIVILMFNVCLYKFYLLEYQPYKVSLRLCINFPPDYTQLHKHYECFV